RHLHPDATMKEMQLVNRVSVLIIILLATIGSFFINSIIDAIHIATFIASASYFFVLMGGMYWKRATSAGATASLCTGFSLQVGLVVTDLVRTAPMAPPYLESLHPLLMGHGVIVAMAFSGCIFVVVSLASRPSERIRLIPFFPDEGLALAASLQGGLQQSLPEGSGVMSRIDVRHCGKTVRLHYSAEILGNVYWKELLAGLSGSGENWVCMAGAESIQRFGHGDAGEFLSCVTV
ncbi:MAG: sodium:solute symporter family protein, partial [Planctomycetes bacterium]|nr:sodium:solute symporter family protein [Planctomycetota bacterium]